jgi:hemoglobin
MSDMDRRAAIVADRIEETGIDEAMIERLVRAFYARIRSHPVLGPVFNARIDDWEFHMQRLCAFWSSVTLMSGRYSGSPMQKHLDLPIDGRHFDQWVALFVQTAHDVCPPAAADFFIERARRIAQSLEMGIAAGQGIILFKGDRLTRPDVDILLPDTCPQG